MGAADQVQQARRAELDPERERITQLRRQVAEWRRRLRVAGTGALTGAAREVVEASIVDAEQQIAAWRARRLAEKGG